MTTFLRRSSNLARLAKTHIDASVCPLSPSLHISLARTAYHPTSRVRTYATVKPGDPKDGKDANANTAGKQVTADGSKPGKPARGFEGLYSDAGPLSHQGASEAKQQTDSPLMSILTKEEQEELDSLLGTIRKGLPASEATAVEKSFEDFKHKGIPPEIREVMTNLKNRPLDIASAAKLVHWTGKLAREQASKQIAEEGKGLTGSNLGGDKNKKSKGDSKKKPGEKNFAEFTANLDTGTFLITAFVAYLLYRTVMPSENSKEITFQEFKTTFFEKGLVDKLTVINRHRVRVDLHREATGRMYPESPAQHGNFRYYFSIGSVEAFEKQLEEAQNSLGIPSSERIPVSYVNEVGWVNALMPLAPTILFVLGIYWISRRAGGGGAGGSSGIFGIGKSKAKKFNQETDVQIRFKDVAGMDEAKQEIMEFVSFLKTPDQYQRLGAKIPRGALLSGPPGTGKTLLAKATAGESQVPFFSISGSEFVEIFVGVGASRVRDLFQNARKNTPCIIFIDEIDAVGKARGKSGFSGGNDEREGTLNQILTEMDGFNTSEQVVVLAGTNRPDVLDKALLRPGRFDRHIAIDRPTTEGRKQIFLVHLRKIVTSEDMDHLTGRLAALTPGFAGADIANCVNEAALIAARTSADKVAMIHFEQAIERVIGGLEKKSLVLNPEEKRTVAYHEAGHAICGWFFKYADPLLKVSIMPRGRALGYAQYLPQGDSYLMNVNQLMDRMAMALAGRVSEELHFDTVTSGASDDFNKVTRMATAMVTKWGMSSKIGYLFYEDDQQQQLHKPFSEATAQNIDSEVRRIVDEAYKQCRDLLTEKKKEVGLVAEELLSKEVIGRDDLVRILGKRPFEDNAEFAKYFDDTGGKSAPPPPPQELVDPPPVEDGPNVPTPGVAIQSIWDRRGNPFS